MSSVSKNAVVAALRGAFVADAASMGTHWIYDPVEMAASVPSLDAPEFKTPPTPKFYSATDFPNHYGPGMLSPYGEQLLFVTEYLVSAQGKVDGTDLSQKMLQWAETDYSGRPDSALKKFVEHMKDGKAFPDCGADDSEAHCLIKIVPVTCLYAGRPELLSHVEAVIRVHQNNDTAVAYGIAAALVLEHALMTGAVPTDETTTTWWHRCPDRRVQDSWKKALDYSVLETLLLDLSHELIADKGSPFYDLAARSCALPGSFVAPCFLLQQAQHAADKGGDESSGGRGGGRVEYTEPLRQNILGAGDTCSRSIFLGAVLAAARASADAAGSDGGTSRDGDAAVPESWVEKMDPATMSRIDRAAAAMADLM